MSYDWPECYCADNDGDTCVVCEIRIGDALENLGYNLMLAGAMQTAYNAGYDNACLEHPSAFECTVDELEKLL